MAEPTNKCANPNCRCPAYKGGVYCSEYCQEPKNHHPNKKCRCGHPSCQKRVAP